LRKQTELPGDFHPHKKVERLLATRREMAEGKRPLDWGTAELGAFATLVAKGTRVRLVGQDSARGTFSHRHAVLHDVVDGHAYMPLVHLSPDQAPIEIYNSALSEAGVLGFEYGYSLDWPDALVAWEAQFGDFANAAQVIFDQFIVSAEDKWKRLSGLTMLLPHGFEGQGPEHSSARLERFLVLAAEENIQIAQPSTPAQYFHLLRRQVLRPWRKPLVVLTPKSLLRHPNATSTLEELASGRFQRVIGDPSVEPAEVRRVLCCSGKIYYEIAQRREELGRKDVAIVRLEQFYPLQDEHLSSVLSGYAENVPVLWVQDEPENMGAWRYLRARFATKLFDRFPFSGICRAESASPATGSASSHRLEQQELLERAFAGL
jgi:2-oxoglutarate dehydrogenase E1 component